MESSAGTDNHNGYQFSYRSLTESGNDNNHSLQTGVENMYDNEKNELLVVFSPVTDKKFVLDPQEKIIHLSTCPSLTTRQEKNYRDVAHHSYQKCPLCLG